MIILLMGPQGAGKGTQGELLSEKLGYPLVGAGALLREEKASGSELGKRIADIIDQGVLVPPDMITEMLEKRLAQPDAQAGVLIDGYPRDPEQLQLMFDRFTPDLAVVLELDDQTAVNRLGGRWLCPDGHIYNVQTNPPQEEGRCDEDGKVLSQRKDDTEEAIRKRLSIYHEDTKPLVAAMEAQGVRVARIDASPGIDEVHQAILEVIEN